MIVIMHKVKHRLGDTFSRISALINVYQHFFHSVLVYNKILTSMNFLYGATQHASPFEQHSNSLWRNILTYREAEHHPPTWYLAIASLASDKSTVFTSFAQRQQFWWSAVWYNQQQCGFGGVGQVPVIEHNLSCGLNSSLPPDPSLIIMS